MNTGCFKCDKAQWDADGCTCEITGLLVGNAERGCEYRKDTELKPCPFCGGKATIACIIGKKAVTCRDCNATMCSSYTPIEMLVEMWNRRIENDCVL